MAKGISRVALIGAALLISASGEVSGADWTSGLASINHMVGAIRANINDHLHRVNQQLSNVQQQLHSTLRDTIEPALQQADTAIKNSPKDAHGRIIANGNYQTFLLNTGNGISRTIVSGNTPDGQPYVRNVVEQYVGNTLYHNETNYNPDTGVTKKTNWKLDLGTPGAEPEILSD